mmetsp:Transcript_93293/g.242993  ORF Transcript_93293/g.242993 Transcript_93293/m.242993 type:complete len:221 (-) Transcript_93293:278-940(-)
MDLRRRLSPPTAAPPDGRNQTCSSPRGCDAGNGRKNSATRSADTSSSVAGAHFGCPSLSTRTALMPSQKSLWGCGLMHHWDILYSIWKASPNVTDRCLRMASSESFTDVGLCLPSICAAPSLHSVPSALSAAMISSAVAAPKQRLMASAFFVSTAFEPSGCAPAATAFTASETACGLEDASPSARRLSSTCGNFSEGQKCVARPACMQSAACSRWPVRPK